MAMQIPVRLLGTGAYLPAECVTAAQLDQRLGLAPGTALARNGVWTRYFVNETETASAMSESAIRQALGEAGLAASDLDAILFSGVMSEQPMPCTAVLIHKRLGGRNEGVTCFDINASCGGFLKGLEVAAAGIQCGLWRRAAVVAAELASKGLRWDDPDTCTLFGDGAAAAVLGPAADGEGIVVSRAATWSEGSPLSAMVAGGSRYNMRTPPPDPDDYLFTMHGRALLRLIQTHFSPFLEELLLPEVRLIVPHQASAVGLAFLRKHLANRRLPAPAVIDILRETGNQVSVSVPFALDRAIRTGALRRGDTALLLCTAAGVAFSGVVLRY